ncbi:MAG TPA: DUF3237 domain-containing protein [Terracidiphilus sp.]
MALRAEAALSLLETAVLFVPKLGALTAARALLAIPKLELVYEEPVTLGPSQASAETPEGKRNIVPITGGTFEGPRLRGKVMPGEWDWQPASPGGCFTIHADPMIQTNDGAIIDAGNVGKQCKSSDGRQGALLTTPTFEAPKGKYDWLNGGAYVGALDEVTSLNGTPAVRARFYRAEGAASAGQ